MLASHSLARSAPPNVRGTGPRRTFAMQRALRDFIARARNLASALAQPPAHVTALFRRAARTDASAFASSFCTERLCIPNSEAISA